MHDFGRIVDSVYHQISLNHPVRVRTGYRFCNGSPSQHKISLQEDIKASAHVLILFGIKVDVSQSTTSQYLSKLEDANLVKSQRIGQ